MEGFGFGIWHGIYAPKGTPKEVTERITKSLQKALQNANVTARFAELGTEPMPADQATGPALEAKLKSEIERWVPVIKAAGVYAD